MPLYCSEEELNVIAEEERDILNASELLRPLNPTECWAGRLAVHQNVIHLPSRGTFPAEAGYDSSQKNVVIHYDALTHEGLVSHYAEGHEPVEDLLQRAYIGAGLARLLFLVEGANAPKNKLNKFVKFMSDQDKLLARLLETMEIKPKEGVLRKFINDADAPAHINGLRLSLGVWKEAHGDDEYATGLVDVFRKSLMNRLASKPQYVAFANIFKVSEEEAEDTFAEHIADIQIAGASPMGREEIEHSIKLLT